MKIEIDLNEILGDEDGSETLNESIRRQVIEAIVKRTKDGLNAKIDKAVGETISTTLTAHLKETLPALIESMLDQEFQPVSEWGKITPKTTIRNVIAETLRRQCVFEPKHYSSDESAYTKTIRDLVRSQMNEFQKRFDKEVSAQFTQEAMAYAKKALADKLGVKV